MKIKKLKNVTIYELLNRWHECVQDECGKDAEYKCPFYEKESDGCLLIDLKNRLQAHLDDEVEINEEDNQ